MKVPFIPRGRDRATPELPSGEMTLVGHLAELRMRLIRSVLAIVVAAVVIYIFNARIFDFLAEPYCDLQEAGGTACTFLIRSPTENFSVVVALAGYGGLILAMPVILYQLARFVLPGLYPEERRVLLPFVAASVLLLALGMTAGYLLMPKTLAVLASFGPESFTEFFSPRDYISFFLKMLLAVGIAAELPLVLIFLQLVGVVPTALLRRNRRIAVVLVVILSAVVTPTGDPFTLGVLAVPMYLFYEIAVFIGGRMTRHRHPTIAS
ncbi:MAG: twin-arginine translocase subunit TatC [Acidimicrobiales bacterium]